MPGRVYALANQKGGVGKTTTAINLAACLAEAGERTLVIDLDPQANATSGLGERANGSSSLDLLDGIPLQKLAKPTRFPRLELVPSRPELAGAAVELARANAALHGVADRVHVAQGNLLEPVPEPVDLVVANLPYLPADERRPEYDAEPPEAVYAPGDGTGPLSHMLELCDAGKLVMPGFVLVQFHSEVLETDCRHLPELRELIVAKSRAAA